MWLQAFEVIAENSSMPLIPDSAATTLKLMLLVREASILLFLTDPELTHWLHSAAAPSCFWRTSVTPAIITSSLDIAPVAIARHAEDVRLV